MISILDERLEKELGIKIAGDDIPDLSKPPPGYPRLPSHANSMPVVMPGAKLGHIPSYTKENKSEDGRHLRIGNMLQIVPTDPEKSRPSPKQSLASPMAAAMVPPPVASGSAVVPEENTKANELLRKLEEQKKLKEAERRQRREQRLAKRAELQKKQLGVISFKKS